MTLSTALDTRIDSLSRQLSSLSPEARTMLLREVRRRNIEGEKGRRFYSMFPGSGPLRREKYSKFMDFFAAGTEHDERAVLGGNRSGKTTCTAYELTAHMTGDYQPWWPGRRFHRPVTSWIVGEDIKALRDSLQLTLLGPATELGTGMIPREAMIGRPSARSGTTDAYDSFLVRHTSGGISRGTFKSYDQGREAFQAAKIDIALLDEEPPISIYTETLLRTMATEPGEPNGIVMCAFTPLKGLSEVVLSYMPYLTEAATR